MTRSTSFGIAESQSPSFNAIRIGKCTRKKAWTNKVHGLPRLLQSTSRTERSFWMLLVGSCFALALWFNQVLLRDYITDNTRLQFGFKWNKFHRYPNLVICPAVPDVLDFDSLEKDMTQRTESISNETRRDLMAFAMAGAGFRYFESYVKKWRRYQIEELNKLFHQWRGNRSISEFYRFMYEDNGVHCENMFHSCYYGSVTLNCCEMFQPMYVALRGRCFRLKMLAQRDLGDAGWLNVALKQLKSPYYSSNKLLNQYVLHISDPYPDVRLFPRFYLNRDNYVHLTLDVVRYWLLPGNPYCSTAKEDQGLGTCQIGSWLRSRVTEPLGCTLFYMISKAPNLTVCQPEVVVSNYFSVTATSTSEQLRTTKISDVQCLPACRRTEYRTTAHRSRRLPPRWKTDAPFRFTMTFNDLQSLEYAEIVTTSLTGFISQIGGQYGLWLGITSTVIIQLLFSVFQWLWFHRKRCMWCYREVDST